MNKKEVLEIRKQYTHEKCSITASAAAMWTEKRILKPAEGSFSFPPGRRNLQIF